VISVRKHHTTGPSNPHFTNALQAFHNRIGGYFTPFTSNGYLIDRIQGYVVATSYGNATH